MADGLYGFAGVAEETANRSIGGVPTYIGIGTIVVIVIIVLIVLALRR
jgi:hypothetical protein